MADGINTPYYERNIEITRRFVEGTETLAKIAKDYELTRERVRQIVDVYNKEKRSRLFWSEVSVDWKKLSKLLFDMGITSSKLALRIGGSATTIRHIYAGKEYYATGMVAQRALVAALEMVHERLSKVQELSQIIKISK